MALLQTPGIHSLAPSPNISILDVYAFNKGYNSSEEMLKERMLSPLEMLAKELKMTGYHVYKNNIAILFQMVEAELNKYGLKMYIQYRSVSIYVFYEHIAEEIFMPDLSGLYFQTDVKVKDQGYHLLHKLRKTGFDYITGNESFEMLCELDDDEIGQELLLEKEFNDVVNSHLYSIPNFFFNIAIEEMAESDDKKLNQLVRQAFYHCNNIYSLDWLRKDFHHDSQCQPSLVDCYNIYHSFDGFDNSLPYSSNKQIILDEIGGREPTFLTHYIKLSKDTPLNIHLFANYAKSIFESLTKLADIIQAINTIYYRKEHKSIKSSKWIADLRKCRRPC
jgi:hypothetical protein